MRIFESRTDLVHSFPGVTTAHVRIPCLMLRLQDPERIERFQAARNRYRALRDQRPDLPIYRETYDGKIIEMRPQVAEMAM